jgi:hypothetical protein
MGGGGVERRFGGDEVDAELCEPMGCSLEFPAGLGGEGAGVIGQRGDELAVDPIGQLVQAVVLRSGLAQSSKVVTEYGFDDEQLGVSGVPGTP